MDTDITLQFYHRCLTGLLATYQYHVCTVCDTLVSKECQNQHHTKDTFIVRVKLNYNNSCFNGNDIAVDLQGNDMCRMMTVLLVKLLTENPQVITTNPVILQTEKYVTAKMLIYINDR